MAKVNDWRFFEQNVQGGLLEGRYMNAAFTMVAAGPPRLAAVAATTPGAIGEELGDIAYPIGVLQSVNLQIGSQWMRLWEIGSERSYFVRGRTQGQVALGRIMYHGPSLLRAMYAYLSSNGTKFQFESLYNNQAKGVLNTKGNSGTKDQFVIPAGYENVWMDLASDVFSQPIGLLLYMRDSNEDTVAAFYLEYCNVQNYGWATDAGGTIITENASVVYERMVPINVGAVSLIKDENTLEGGFVPVIGATVIGSAAGPGSATP